MNLCSVVNRRPYRGYINTGIMFYRPKASHLHAWASYYNDNVCMLTQHTKHNEPLHVFSMYLFSLF